MLDTSQASATGHSLAISIPSMPPPADSAASSPASITTTLSAPAGSGTSRNSAGFRAAGGKFSGNQRNTISSGRWSRNTNGPRGGTLPNSPVGPSARGLASSNGFGPGGPGLPVTGRGPGKASGRGRGRGGSQRQDPQAAASPFNAEAWQQSQAAAAAAFYQTQVCSSHLWSFYMQSSIAMVLISSLQMRITDQCTLALAYPNWQIKTDLQPRVNSGSGAVYQYDWNLLVAASADSQPRCFLVRSQVHG